MPNLAKHLNNAAYVLLLCCLVSVSLALSLETRHVFDPIKQVFFHFFVFIICFLIVFHSLITSTLPIRKDLLHILVASYLGYNALSFVLSPYADIDYFMNLVLLIAFFFAVARLVNSEWKYSYLLYVIGGIVFVSSVYAFLQFFRFDFEPLVVGFGKRGLGMRVFSFFGNPNMFAAFLVMSFPLLLSGFLTKRRFARAFFAVGILFAMVALFLTGTQAAFLGFVISILLFFVITYGQARRKTYLWAVSITLILIVAGFLYSSQIEMSALRTRQYYWKTALEIFQDHPFFGSGISTFDVFYPVYRVKSEERTFGTVLNETETLHVHSEFLEVLSDLGLFGLLLFLGIFFAFFYRYYSLWDSQRKYLFAGNCCAIMGALVHSLYSVNLRFFFVAIFFWLNLALQSALLSGPEPETKITISKGRVLGALLVLPLFVVLFLAYSTRLYSAEYHLNDGLAFFDGGAYRDAEPHLKKAVTVYPEHKRALYYLGISQIGLGKLMESRQTLNRLIQLDPNYLQSHYWLASVYYKSHDFEKAEEQFLESVRVNETYGPSYLALGLLSLDKDVEQSIAYFERAYALSERDEVKQTRIHALQQLIEIHQRLGNDQKTQTYVEKLREIEG